MTINTKWPRLIVTGEPVTEQQANEILIRTCIPNYLRGNDRAWSDAVAKAMGFPAGEDFPPRGVEGDERMAWFKERWTAQDRRSVELGIVPLEYLYNSRIASSWIGGSHGWCNWGGTIGTADYNIGKWPSTESVTEEWQLIAAAFPFLQLDAQVIEDEGEGDVADQWHIADGVAELVEPGEMLTRVRDPQVFACLLPGGERGVSLGRLREAVEQMDAKFGGAS